MSSSTQRWRIEGTLTTGTPLHIGDGGTTTRVGLVVKEGQATRLVQVSSVATDVDGHPYIPGRTLKNNLRTWLGLSNLDPKVLDAVFGTEDQEASDAIGGAAEFHDSFLKAASANGDKLPHWSPSRCTAVSASTARSRLTRTVATQKLFHEEIVPPGTTFEAVITGTLTQEDVIALLLALDGFDHPEHPARLGAGRRNGRGRLHWQLTEIATLGDEGKRKWLELVDPPVAYAALAPLGPAERVALQQDKARSQFSIRPPVTLRVHLALGVEDAFMVNDPSYTSGAYPTAASPDRFDGHEAADCSVLRDGLGRVLLPADSLRGALRAQAERIVRTLGGPACYVEDTKKCCPAPENDREDTITKWLRGLCLTCRVFGSAGLATAVEVSDFLPPASEGAVINRQEFVAVDRFTGGGAPGLKFNAEPAWRPMFEGDLALELERIEPWALGLLVLALRDLIEGDIQLGFGSGKGYGRVTGKIMGASVVGDPTTLSSSWQEVLREALGRGVQSFREQVAASHASQMGTMLCQVVRAFRDNVAGRAAASQQPILPAAPGVQGPVVSTTVLRTAVPGNSASPVRGGSPGGRFHNPYHFVPFGAEVGTEGLTIARFDRGELGHVAHDRFVARTTQGKPVYSGRILCRLTTRTETVIGGKQEKQADESRLVHRFTIGGQPAIPASSLRGAISAVTEAASNSAMRVLADVAMSRRKEMRENPMTAIGIVVNRPRAEGGTSRCLIPVALPFMPCHDAGGRGARIPDSLFVGAALKVYLDGYVPLLDDQGRRVGVKYRVPSWIETNRPRSFSPEHQEFWYLKLAGVTTIVHGLVTCTAPKVKKIPGRNGARFFLDAQSSIGDPIPADTWQRKPCAERELYVPGILRVLGIDGRGKQLPTGKKHEIFIPLPLADPEHPERFLDVADAFDAEAAITQFDSLACDRKAADAEFPFELEGAERDTGHNPKKPDFRLRHGDVVFFRAGQRTGAIQEVAISSIWRAGVGSTWEYFGKISKELLPLNPDRDMITIAEQLFGFVEQGVPDERGGRSFAGRVSVSFGVLPEREQVDEGTPIPLRLLMSPKPPSPTLYFEPSQNGGPVAKSDLAPGTHRPLGRKFYLHKKESDLEPWRAAADADPKNRAFVDPLPPGLAFFFHVDFANLSLPELELLCFALSPNGAFRHKIGMGKPLGLGSVRIDPLAVLYVDRMRRYSEDDPLSDGRYHGGWLDEAFWRDEQTSAQLPSRYSREARQAQLLTDQVTAAADKWPGFNELRDAQRARMDPGVCRALDLLGDPTKVRFWVRYPFCTGQAGETEGFRWHQSNEAQGAGGSWSLEPLRPDTEKLPELPVLGLPQTPERGRGGQ